MHDCALHAKATVPINDCTIIPYYALLGYSTLLYNTMHDCALHAKAAVPINDCTTIPYYALLGYSTLLYNSYTMHGSHGCTLHAKAGNT